MSEVYVDKKGIAHDDEGHSWNAPGFSRGVYSGTHIRPRSKFNAQRKRPEINRDKLNALYLALYYEPKNRILSYAAKALAKGGEVNAKEAKQIRDIMKKNGMKKEAKFFEDSGIGMRCLLDRIEESANLITKKYDKKEAEKLFSDFSSGKIDYPADKWGNPKNKNLKRWFDKFKDQEMEHHKRSSLVREFPYFT